MSTFFLSRMPPRDVLGTWKTHHPAMDVGAVEAYLKMMNVAGRISEEASAHLARRGLSQGGFRVLLQLRRSPEGALRPSEVAERMGITRATVTVLTDGLVRKGFIRRVPSSQDRRSADIHLLHKGRRLVDSVLPERFRYIARVMRPLSSADRERLIRCLEKISSALIADKGRLS